MSAEAVERTRQAPTFQLLAEDLAELGVEVVFGLFGEDEAGLVTQLAGSDIRYHPARHENEGVMMAAGYAKATGKLGVCVTSRGPGLTNGLTGVVSASREGAPVLMILASNATSSDEKLVNYKHLSGNDVLSHSGVKTLHPRTAAQARGALREAAAIAMTGCTVGLTIPRDILNGKTEATVEEAPVAREAGPLAPAAESIEVAAEVVNGSRRVLIVAGAGAYKAGAREVLIELAERTGALLGTTLGAKGLFQGHPFHIGLVGGFASAAAREVAGEVDCALVFGASLNQFSTNFGAWFRGATLIQVDDRREQIGRHLRADVGVAGDARLAAEQLLAAIAERDDADKPLRDETVRHRLATYDPSEDFVSVPEGSRMDPQALIVELDRILPSDRMVVPDGGAHFCFVSPFMSVESPDRYHAPIAFHSIALGLGTAVGAAVGRPETPTILYVGDGALLMSLGELETVARTGLPTLVVVVNDRSYGAEQHFVELMGLPHETTLIPDIDFAAVARGLGLEAVTIESLDELLALRDQIANLSAPLLLDCKVANVRPRLYDELLGGAAD